MPRSIKIVNTTNSDFATIISLFKEVMKLQGINGYEVWKEIDVAGLQNDIENKLQYKILQGDNIIGVFSIQHNDPFIWREKDKSDAIYLHRIIVHPAFKGQRQFEKILAWAKLFAQQNNLMFIRMDTWASNYKLINYYTSFGFQFIENYTTPNTTELPLQNRNLNVALLELEIDE